MRIWLSVYCDSLRLITQCYSSTSSSVLDRYETLCPTRACSIFEEWNRRFEEHTSGSAILFHRCPHGTHWWRRQEGDCVCRGWEFLYCSQRSLLQSLLLPLVRLKASWASLSSSSAVVYHRYKFDLPLASSFWHFSFCLWTICGQGSDRPTRSVCISSSFQQTEARQYFFSLFHGALSNPSHFITLLRLLAMSWTNCEHLFSGCNLW